MDVIRSLLPHAEGGITRNLNLQPRGSLVYANFWKGAGACWLLMCGECGCVPTGLASRDLAAPPSKTVISDLLIRLLNC